MPKLTATSQDAELHGATIIALLRSINRDNYIHILNRYGLTKIDADKWYPQQLVLDIQKEILTNTDMAMFNLVSIGMKVGDRDVIPAQSLEDALENLEASHQKIHRNITTRGYEIQKLAERHIQVTDHTPYPNDLIYGMLYAIVMRHKPEDSQPVVRRQNAHETEFTHDGPAVYDITW